MYLVAVVVHDEVVDLCESFASIEGADWVSSRGGTQHGGKFWCGCGVHCEARYADC